MTIGSLAALAIVSAFVLPGYLTRGLVGRRVPLPKVDALQLLLQSITISFGLDVVVLVAWLALASLQPRWGPLPLFRDLLLNGAIRQTIEVWIVLLVVIMVYAMGIVLGASRGRAIEWIVQKVLTLGGSIRTTPLAYYLFTEFPKLSTALVEVEGPDDAPLQPWIRIVTTDGTVITGRIFQYGVHGPDTGDLVILEAHIQESGGAERDAIGFVYVPRASVARYEVAYKDNADQLRVPWEAGPERD